MLLRVESEGYIKIQYNHNRVTVQASVWASTLLHNLKDNRQNMLDVNGLLMRAQRCKTVFYLQVKHEQPQLQQNIISLAFSCLTPEAE